MLLNELNGNYNDNYAHIVSKSYTNIKELVKYSLSENKFRNNLSNFLSQEIY